MRKRFRHDPRFASGYRESPRLSTYFAAFNRHRGPLRDVELRRSLARAVDVPGIVRRTLGRLAIPAHGLIPPGPARVLGGELRSGSSRRRVRPPTAPWRRRCLARPWSSRRPFTPSSSESSRPFSRELSEAFRASGFRLRPINQTMAEYLDSAAERRAQISSVGRWNADYPDADTFVHGALHSPSRGFGSTVGVPEIDRLAEQGRAETDPRIRHSIYRQVEELVERERPVLPLFHDQVYCFARPEVEGLGPSARTRRFPTRASGSGGRRG